MMSRIFLLLVFSHSCLLAQKLPKEQDSLLHKTNATINVLVDQKKYRAAIAIALRTAGAMEIPSQAEAYIRFMLKAAEIETFEVWKGKGFNSVDIHPDYRRPLRYLQTLTQHAGQFLDQFPALHANTIFTSAVVYYWLDMPDTALTLHDRAMLMRSKLYGPSSREVADSYLWRAVLYKWGLNRRDLAEADYEASLPLQEKYLPESRYALGSVYYGLADIAMENFQFDVALAFANQYRSLYNDLPYEQAFALQLIANVYWNQNDFDRALAFRQQAMRLYERSDFREDLVIEYNNLANDLSGMGRHTEAKKALMRALRILQTSGAQDPHQANLVYGTLGALHVTMKDYDSAARCFSIAMDIAVANYGIRNDATANVSRMRGDMHRDQRLFEKALDDFQQMLAAVILDFVPEGPFEIPSIQYENPYFATIITASFRKADTLLDWYRSDGDITRLMLALDHYNHAWRQIMIARNSIGDELSRTFLVSNFNESIENSMMCAQLLYELTADFKYFEHLFDFVELTKYLNVLDALQRAERAGNAQTPVALLFQIQSVRSRLNALQRIEFDKDRLALSDDSVAQLRNDIVALIQQRKQLVAKTAPPAEGVFTTFNTIRVSDIQKQLTYDEQIIEFYWGARNIFIISVTRDTLLLQTIAHQTETDSAILMLQDVLMRRPSFRPSEVQRYSRAASDVFDELFKPFVQKKKLIVIPDGPVSLVPVEALVVKHDPEVRSYRGLRYAIFYHEISYAYSSRIRFYGRSNGHQAIRKVLAFSYGNAPDAASSAFTFADLPGSVREIEVLSDVFEDVSLFAGKEALKKTFLQYAGQYDVIHLGVHGISDDNNAGHSRLVFRGDSIRDPDLYAYEIYNLDLDARLAVLTACETGRGKLQAGEGIFSIGRAFIYAGCPSVVMSLWRTHDKHTSSLIGMFYKDLRQGNSIAASLRSAKQKFLNNADAFSSHPGSWAAIILNGQDRSFEAQRSPVTIWFVAVMGTLLLLILLKTRRPFHR